MTRELACSRTQPMFLWLALLTIIVSTVPAALTGAAEVTEDRSAPADPQALTDLPGAGRVVVDPVPEWSGWSGPNEGWNPGGPRVDVWVDRGDWGSYRPGDQLYVFFRVDRPCYVTILDYAPDGRVDVLFPNRWSGSNFVRPGRTYRVPESRRYSLRIAGPGGVETLIACAHEVPWPSGPDGYWIPPYLPRQERVIPGRPGGQTRPSGRHGRVVVGPGGPRPWPGAWPVPGVWVEQSHRWGCDSVSFSVSARQLPWLDTGQGWHGDVRGDHYRLLDDTFTMSRCSDSYYRDVYYGRDPLVINIACVESRDGGPTEIAGRLIWEDGWGSEAVFRIDVEGQHGERPRDGRIFAERIDGLLVEIEIKDLKLAQVKPWQLPRIEWIQFGVRVSAD